MPTKLNRTRGRSGASSLYLCGALAVGAAVAATATYNPTSWLGSSTEEKRQQLIDDMVSNTVKVHYSQGHGSGVLFVRGEDVFCITAAHVVLDRKPRNLFENFPFGVGDPDPEGSTYGTKTIILSRHTQDEEKFEDALYTAVLVAADSNVDVAILRVKGSTVKDFPGLKGASFDLRNNKSLKPGTKTIHVGNWNDSIDSVSEGVICNPQHPMGEAGPPPWPQFRVLNVTNMVGPGSSGGPLFLESSGKCIGLIVRVENMPRDAIAIPIYEVYKWAQTLDMPLGYLFEEPA